MQDSSGTLGASYCATSAIGYEGPTTTFGDLKIGTDAGTHGFAFVGPGA